MTLISELLTFFSARFIGLFLLLYTQGFANGISVASSGRFMAVAVGQEHKLGRWSRIKGVSKFVVGRTLFLY
jgi:hypothetical protein